MPEASFPSPPPPKTIGLYLLEDLTIACGFFEARTRAETLDPFLHVHLLHQNGSSRAQGGCLQCSAHILVSSVVPGTGLTFYMSLLNE